ncbi:hypothetical protein HRR78_001424 [Exophiala dermatitidis]|nr:hypothetical protein HRR75_003806 [Exophiala dermatitidis]KAJ4557751.1 hypothetical protein HRR78_001424 [Exophiala dermatitidis]
MDSFDYLQIAKIIGVTGAAWLSARIEGNITALSLMATPALGQSKTDDNTPSTTLAKQWSYIYNRGKVQNPPVAAITAGSFFYLAWSTRTTTPQSQLPLLYGSAAAATLGIVPFTLLLMASTNSKLIRHTAASSKELNPGAQQSKDEEILRLLGTWTTLNAVRGLFPLVGAVIGLVAILG